MNQMFGSIKMIYLPEKKKRTRLVVKRGIENISMPLEDIVLFFTENRIVFAIDHLGKKYIVEKNLTELEQELDDNVFFRANRQYLISVRHVRSFKPYERVKLKIDMKEKELNDQYHIIISQETAPAFKKWIHAA